LLAIHSLEFLHPPPRPSAAVRKAFHQIRQDLADSLHQVKRNNKDA